VSSNNTTPSGFIVNAADVASLNASRLFLRPVCRSSVLGTLDYVFDGIFWTDMLAVFITGVTHERSTDVWYASLCTAYRGMQRRC
jgi:hypothetical protein